MKALEDIIKLFPRDLQNLLRRMNLDFDKLQEIRLRVGCPLLLRYDGQEILVGTHETGQAHGTGRGEPIIRSNAKDPLGGRTVTVQEIRETMEAVGRYSLYAYEEELRQGFLTIQGGHRVGVAGKTVLEGDKIRSMKYISFLNMRLSHQVKGCGDGVLPFLYGSDGQLCHTLIISPPRCGKTTLLRDLIRQISDGVPGKYPGCTVGVVDERSEIAGSYQGIPANDLGMRTDVLDCCPKAEGMMMLIRSMAPEVVAVDEIGSLEEIRAIDAVLHCGCKLLATVHGSSLTDVQRKPLLEKLVQEQVFERYVILQSPGYAGSREGGCSIIGNRNGKPWQIGQVQKILDQQGGVLHSC